MEKEELRRLVFEVLKQDPQTHLNALEFRVRNLTEDYERYDALKIQEIVWDLLVQGVLAPGKNSLNLHLPFFHVTEYGEESLQSGDIILHDYDRYLHHLEASIDEPLDQTIRTYVHAAQKAFLSGNYLATMALLADAGKRCIDMVSNLLQETRYQAVDKGECSPHAELERILKVLQSLPLKQEQHREAILHLQGLENLISHTRDRNGCPRALSIDHRSAQGALLLFPQHVGTIYALIAAIRDASRA